MTKEKRKDITFSNLAPFDISHVTNSSTESFLGGSGIGEGPIIKDIINSFL